MAVAWTTIQNALRTWVTNAAPGLTDAIFADQHGGEPAQPYATIKLKPARRAFAQDELRWSTAASWAAATAYAVPTRVISGTNLYQCVTAGTSAIVSPAWAGTTGYQLGNQVVNGGNVYQCSQAGTSASSGGPSGTGSGIIDGTCRWNYVSATGGPTGTGSAIADGSCVWAYVSASLGNEVLPTVVGQREFIVSLEAFSDAVTGTGTATELLEQALVALGFPSVQTAFAAASICCVDAGQPQDLSQLLSTKIASRALVDLRFRTLDAAADVPTGYIATTLLTPTYS